MYNSASQAWSALDGIRRSMLTRIERYAALTIPKVCLPDGYDQLTTDETHDYQSLGAQAVNHLSNKLMLSMFAPSRPFLKLVPGKKTKAKIQQMGASPVELDQILASGEREAIAALDRTGQRPKLFSVMRHLIVAGNVCLDLSKQSMRALALRNFVVKRDIEGDVKMAVIHECLRFDELDPEVQKILQRRYSPETKVDFYKWINRNDNGAYTLSQWVNETRLPKPFDGRYPKNKLPYLFLTWDLGDEADYGTSLVEEYAGDLEALSTLSESIVDGAVLGTEYRWLVNPNGTTQVEDLQNSKNGDALPGVPTDIAPSQGGNPSAITVAEKVLDRYERRVARGFLMGSAVIRDAERVTTEEVRLTAQELETAYGGVYSTLATSLQKPVGEWLFKQIDLDLKGTDIDLTVVTGLDALSRNGDLENLRLALADLGGFATLPEALLVRLDFDAIAAFVGQGRNIDLLKFLKSSEQTQDDQATQAAARVEETAATAAAEAAAQGQAQ